MATKISELNTSVTAVANDLFITVTDTANAAAIETKKITFQGLANSLPGILNITGSEGVSVNATADANVIALSINVASVNAAALNTSSIPAFSSFTIANPESNISYTQTGSSNNNLVIETGDNLIYEVLANNTILIDTRYLANGTNLDLSGNTTHESLSLANDPSIVGNTTLGTNSTNITTFNSIPILPILSAAPTSPVTGMLVVADYTNWDPLSSATPRPYPVFYDGAVWQGFYP